MIGRRYNTMTPQGRHRTRGYASARFDAGLSNRAVLLRSDLSMLTGDLVRVRTSKERIIPLYLNRNSPQWLEAAESLLAIFREGVGLTRGEIEEEIDQLFGGGGKATLAHRGIAKVLEDRAEFEVVADVPPEQIREKVFTAAAEARRRLRAARPAAGSRGQPGIPTNLSPRRGALVGRQGAQAPAGNRAEGPLRRPER